MSKQVVRSVSLAFWISCRVKKMGRKVDLTWKKAVSRSSQSFHEGVRSCGVLFHVGDGRSVLSMW